MLLCISTTVNFTDSYMTMHNKQVFDSDFDSGNLARVSCDDADSGNDKNSSEYAAFNAWTSPDCAGTQYEATRYKATLRICICIYIYYMLLNCTISATMVPSATRPNLKL